ncbi:hypothetical protein UFOVP29_360 [uncultured Caudovirales phage]|uniref:Uncharacterized protein n=1 Tax=uncultured Caudovirales phage TaxID=2100421 RepID=A0A6J5KN33_9CAUD|nr:hypothetical protein UFOVP29_360 [uncultured Caudovirales phage]
MHKTPAMRWPDFRPVRAWVEQNFGPENSGRWNLEYAGGISNVNVRWCFQDKNDLDLFLDQWGPRA